MAGKAIVPLASSNCTYDLFGEPMSANQAVPFDKTLTLALPPPLLPYSLISLKPHPRRPIRLDQGLGVRSSPTGDTPPCTECGKRFPSWKALFGHMRCHPERQWRGITPPPHARHVGGGGSSAAAGAGRQFTMQEREVAASLLMLSGARKGSSKGKKSAAASPSATESRAASASASAAPWPVNCEDHHKCSVCDRRFASGQALGGHKRCHWDRACTEVVMIASAGSSRSAMSEAVAAAVLDLNLPPPGPPLVLDLKLGYC